MSTVCEKISAIGAERIEREELAEQRIIEVLPAVNLTGLAEHAWLVFSAGDRVLFESLGWNCYKVLVECQRVGVVQRTALIAGTSTDRRAAANRLNKAEANSEKQRPKLESRLAKLRAEINELDGEENAARAAVTAMGAAVTRLRQYAPERIKSAHNLASKELKARKGGAANITPEEQAEVDAMLDVYGR